MSTLLGEARVRIRPDTTGFEGAAKKGILGSVGKVAAAAAGVFAAAAVGNYLKGAVTAASDLSENTSKVGVVFGKQSDQILKSSKTAATAMGLSQNAYLQANGDLGNLLVSLKIAPKAAAGMSQQMVKLAGDMASFNNVSPEEAMAAIKSGLTGETEPLKRFGVNMNDATLKAQALKMGLIKTTKDAMSPQTKALAAQALIMSQTGTAQGDFARTSGGLANQQRILTAQLDDVKVKIGTHLLPVVTKVTTAFNGFITGMTDGTGAGGALVGTFKSLWASIEPIATMISGTLVMSFKALFAAFQEGDVTSDGLVGAFERIGVFAKEVLVPAFNEIKTFIVTQVVPAFMQIVAAIQGFVAVALPIVIAFVTGMMARIGPMMPAIRSIFQQIGAIVLAVMGLIQAIIQRVTTVIAFIWSRWGTQIMDFIAKMWAKILVVIQAALQIIQGIIKTVTSLIKGDWSGAWNGIKQILSGVWNLIKGVISAGLSYIKGILSGAWAVIKVGVSAAWGGIKGAISSAWDGIKTAVAGKIRDVITAISGIKGKITGALSGAGTWLLDTGRNIVTGLINGVKGMAGTLGNAIVSMIPGPIQGVVKKALGIHSPSKVFAKIGQQTVQGLIVGVKGEKPVLTKAMKRLVDLPKPGSLDLPMGSGLTSNPATGLSGGRSSSPLIGGNLTIQSRDGNVRDDLGEVMFQLRRTARGGVYA